MATTKVVKIASDDIPQDGAPNNGRTTERKKFLTMKYGQDQMKLVKKRLAIEDWVDEELMDLYEIQDGSMESYPCEVDLDILLDLGTEEERSKAMWELLKTSPKPKEEIEEFIVILLSKLKSL